MAYKRALLKKMISRLQEPRRFIQVIAGPRQVGKTTLAGQIVDELAELTAYHTADDTTEYGTAWIDRIWEALRVRMRLEGQQEAVLFIDEIQKIKDWSETVKKNWDKDTRNKLELKLVLLGSSRLLMQEGLSDSLAGRFEFNHCGYWSLAEMEEAFSFSAEQYQWFGGYPGAAGLIVDELRFKEYIRSAIVEPTLTRDILMTTRID
ncbi:MAG: AAA family ATPase, partial [Synergistaceae bacterium]|nr:AAA family ATPase [Synergistaceae bacterium]